MAILQRVPLPLATENFAWSEFFSPDIGELILSPLTLHHITLLQELRERLGRPLKVTSGYRSPQHNQMVGGAARSMHLKFATDITPIKLEADERDIALTAIYHLAQDIGFTGMGRYNTFIHLDCRGFVGRVHAEWDKRTEAGDKS